MPVINFEQVWATRERSGKCPTCGKRTVRKFRECNTVNPFNKNEDGTVRNRAQVKACIEAKADEWVPNFQHAKCAEADELRAAEKGNQS